MAEDKGKPEQNEPEREEVASTLRMVNSLLSNSVKAGASDIHLEPFEKESRIRLRVDGILRTIPSPPKELHNKIVSCLKVMASLDVSERRLPQDGRVKTRVMNRSIDMRLSFLPSNFGEKVVIRILDPASLKVDLKVLGFEPETLAMYEKNIHRHHGVILITGPTGSGKTTTLYSTLATINSPERNIVTIEDPIEYVLPGIIQVQAKPEIGFTFASGLRTFLRQDPNIIMVGEIRDKETAEIAINAALTGHLVLSTLHTNSAPGAITRLENLGVEPFLTSSAVVMIVAQRLLRKICPECTAPVEVPAEVLTRHGVPPEAFGNAETATLQKGQGCFKCSNTGYKGRVSCYEVMEMHQEIRRLVLKSASVDELKEAAMGLGMISLQQSALMKVLAGATTLEEAMRVTLAEGE